MYYLLLLFVLAAYGVGLAAARRTAAHRTRDDA
jgi:hypothetical protein